MCCYVQVCIFPFVVVAYLENCRLERTACLNEILLETGGEMVWKLPDVESGLQTVEIT
jgi:hypothetical protein